MKLNYIYHGETLEVLKTFKDKSINCVMTSPPYWALRDYGVKGQLGLEPNFEEFITKLCDIFDEVKRILRDDGTCWINLGDTYSGSGAGHKDTGKAVYSSDSFRKKPTKTHLSDKCLTLVPFRFVIEMVNRGWILRNVIIWYKPNCMPSSAKDRFTVDFEYLFFFVKNKKYWFETQREGSLPSKIFNIRVRDVKKNKIKYEDRKASYKEVSNYKEGYREIIGRNKRTVWKIPTQPFPEAHFAVYPEKLCETPILAGCPKGGIVLDPFMGSGTTGLVARKLGRNYIGIELNKEYIELAEKRLKGWKEQKRLM